MSNEKEVEEKKIVKNEQVLEEGTIEDHVKENPVELEKPEVRRKRTVHIVSKKSLLKSSLAELLQLQPNSPEPNFEQKIHKMTAKLTHEEI